MYIMDCTLRDGANVVGTGFSTELTKLMIEGLIDSHIKVIEMGHCTGLGSVKAGGKSCPVTDEEYLETIVPYADKADIGMFQTAAFADAELIALAAAKGIKFLRVGANAGDGKKAEKAVKMVRDAGLEAKYSLMKAYVVTPEELAEEAKMLESFGVQAVTIMDSAGYMMPEDAAEYTRKIVNAVSIPVGFHGHSNLGLAMANAQAAEREGAAFIDCGLMGMARSAGNITTEGALALFRREGKAQEMVVNVCHSAMKPYKKLPMPWPGLFATKVMIVMAASFWLGVQRRFPVFWRLRTRLLAMTGVLL